MRDEINTLMHELIEIEDKLIKNINNIDMSSDFNDKLIELITKFPEQKQLIKFIIYINDNLSNKQIKNRDTIIETISQLIEEKKKILKLIEQAHTKPKENKNILKKINFSFIKNISNTGWISITIIIISFLIFIFLIDHPEKTNIVATAIEKIKK